MKNSTCKDCNERYLGCHDSCEKYQAYKEQCRSVNNKEREDRCNSVGWDGYMKVKKMI